MSGANDTASLAGRMGGIFGTNFVDDANIVIPNGVSLFAAHVVSDGAPVAVTIPEIVSCKKGACILLACPNGAANNVTITPRVGTINGAGNLVVSAANIVMLTAAPGLTDWKALVVA